jgi:hypothetical protein
MIDISQTTAPKSDQLNSDDLIGGPRTITITRVSANEGGDQPINVFFEGDDNKPFRPCKGMRRVMMAIWGNDGSTYAGKSMTIWRDPDVTWGGMAVGGIRISHMSHMDRDTTLAVTESKTKRKPLVVKMLRVEAPKPAPTTAAPENAFELAHAAASKGTAAFTEWWNSDVGKTCREAVKPNMAEIKATAAAADAATTDEAPM